MSVDPHEGLKAWTHVIYGLHAFSVLAGIVTPAFVVTAFLLGWPSIIAVILNYVKRSDVRGTYLESHFRWQIRTFWWAAFWVMGAIVLMLTIVGIPLAWLMVVATGFWVLYRIMRGWLALNDERAIV